MPKFTVYLMKEDFKHIPRYIKINDQIREHKKSIFTENVCLFTDTSIINYLKVKKEKPKTLIKANSIYDVYYRKSKKDEIWWAIFWQIKDNLELQTADALIVLKITNRIFIITHGHSRHYINPYGIEYDFGLKTAVNLIDDKKIKSADLFTPSEIGLRTKKQTGKNTKFEEYDINIYNTLLKKIAGNIKDEYIAYFKNIDGADSIKFSFSSSITELKVILNDLIHIYQSKSYLKSGFDWIDNFRPVKDKTKILKLNELLIGAINNYDDNVILSLPTIINDTNDIYYKFKRISSKITRKQFDNFEIETTYYKFLKDEAIVVSSELLAKHQLHVIDFENNYTLNQFPIYHCLLYEVKLGEDYFILESGVWYRVDSKFKRDIDVSINELLTNTWDLEINYDRRNISAKARKFKKSKEYIFNQQLANHYNEKYIAELMDSTSNLISYNKNKIELCDVLVKKDKDDFLLIHNKYKYGSSALSHLFSQGNVSAELLIENDFRRAANKKIKESLLHFPEDNNFQREKYTVIYGIISKKNRSGEFSIPLFSKINLKIFVRNLVDKLNFKVKISFVHFK